jgi:hypothetical protein
MNVSRLLIFVMFVTLLMGTTTAWSETPDYEDLSSAVYPTLKPTEQYAALRLTGVLIAGQDDPIGKSEYYLTIAGSKDGTDAQNFGVGSGLAQLMICKYGDGMKKGEKRSFKADLPMKWFEEFEKNYLSFALMERDEGMGFGSLRMPFYHLFGFAPDKVSTTTWLSIDDFKGETKKLDFGPTTTGTHMQLTLEWIPKPVTE